MKARKTRLIPLAAALFVLSLASPLLAECERCRYHEYWWGLNAYCYAVPPDGSTGVTQCQASPVQPSVACTEFGTVCSVLDVPSGGGGAGGGGGLACTSTSAGCPAECFSCGPRPLYI